MSKEYHYLFGPVPSRRLGSSLGVDLIPFKTCTMNCTFCQLGETPCVVSERRDYVPMQDVLSELTQWRDRGGRADHITLAGSGEPTLHKQFGEVFRWVKDHTDFKSVLLSNGTLMHLPEVREEAVLADKVKVTLSAWDEASFQQIHRPAQGVTFELLVQGEQAFRRQYQGELSVEVFIIDGVNSQLSKVRKIAEVLKTLNPERIDVNTAVRPPAVESVGVSPEEHLQDIAEIFGPNASVTASFKKRGEISLDFSEAALLGLLKRHPASCKQLAEEFNRPADKMFKTLNPLVLSGVLKEEKRGAEAYYYLREDGEPRFRADARRRGTGRGPI